MGMIDALTTFGTAVALTADANLTNALDLKAVTAQLGTGRGLQVCIHVDVAADHTTGDETYTFNVITSASANLGTPTTVATKTILYSALAINTLHTIDIPENVDLLQYLGLAFDGGGTTPTVTITAWLANRGSTPSFVKYPNGYDA